MPKLLVIDDEAPLATLISRFFGAAGFEVETATSGRDGLSRALASRPDAIVLDIMMPDLDGYEVCRRLRADPRTARATIVILTARSQLVDKQMALRSGADAHIVKPFDGKALVRGVTELLVTKPRTGLPGRQITVVRLKAGAGATTLVANLALALSADGPSGRLVAAVDATGQEALGRIIGVLGAESTASSGSARVAPAEWAAAHLLRHPCGLFVVPSLPNAPAASSVASAPGGASAAAPALTMQVLSSVRSWFDLVVVDTPVALGALAPVILGASSLVLLMLAPDSTAPRAAQVTAAAIVKAAGRPLPVWPVLSGVAHGPEGIQRQVEQALGLPGVALPWTPDDCARAEAGHKPVVLGQPQSPLAVAVRSLAERIRAWAGESLPGAAA